MCGISGIWHRDGHTVEASSLESMNAMLVHRGPDGEGVLVDGEIGFGHRRLEIIDPGPGGHQPMTTPNGDLWIVFNGEIHNYLEIRGELEPEGVSFRSTCDTEVLLEAYRKWGVDCFSKFNGMWAAAIWDRRRRRLVLSRDHFGIKPLYYSLRGPRLAFASEPKAILRVFPEERDPDLDSVYWFLSGASPDSGGETFFDNVRAVPQASYLEFDAAGPPRERVYWTLDASLSFANGEPEEALRAILTDAVKIRLRSDVPVGACLSGGLDSSAIVRLAAPELEEPMHCFTMRLREPGYDETEFAVVAADDERSFRHHWIEPTPNDMLDVVGRIVWHHDGPCAARGRYGKWHTFEEAGRHVKVVVDGQGADELLAGYGQFFMPFLFDCWRFGGRNGDGLGWLRQARAVTEISSRTWRRLAFGAVPPLSRLASSSVWPSIRLIRRELRRQCRAAPKRTLYRSWLCPEVDRPFDSHLNNALWGEFRYCSLPELLHAEDALGMAHSVEARPAFLDRRLVELCFSLRFDQKIRDGWRKSLLRRALDGVLPPKIQWRRDKKGYPLPCERWLLRHEHNYPEVVDLLLGPEAMSPEFLDRGSVRKFLDRRRVGKTHPRFEQELTWRIVTLELWMRQFLRGDSLRAPGS